MSIEASDHELILRAQRGDRQAFTELVCRHQEPLSGMIYRMCGDLRQAEDAAQEAFVRAWLNLKKYKPEYTFRSWLYRIAANAALDTLRRERPSVELDSLQLADSSPAPEQAAEENPSAAQVRSVIDHPPSRPSPLPRERG